MSNTPVPSALPCRHRSQRGSVLVVGMLLLLMMTLLGLVTTTETRTDARITSNNLDRAIAFQAAEAALRDAESKLAEPNPAEALGGEAGFYSQGEEPSSNYASWDDTNSYEYPTAIPGVAASPRYVIDQLSPSEMLSGYVVIGEVYYSRERNVYRVTVVSTGRSGQTQVVLQTTYVPPGA
jgi:type IV pilus assembly protein PilX